MAQRVMVRLRGRADQTPVPMDPRVARALGNKVEIIGESEDNPVIAGRRKKVIERAPEPGPVERVTKEKAAGDEEPETPGSGSPASPTEQASAAEVAAGESARTLFDPQPQEKSPAPSSGDPAAADASSDGSVSEPNEESEEIIVEVIEGGDEPQEGEGRKALRRPDPPEKKPLRRADPPERKAVRRPVTRKPPEE